MREIKSLTDLRSAVSAVHCSGKSVGLVPTMGYLHAGHLRLISAARTETDVVVMSLFVNPTQFGPAEDFERYPRDLERDRLLAQESGTDLLFVPALTTMYPDGPGTQTVWVDPGPLATHLCGASRPGHFRGVATVVTKLFSMVQPDIAYFGQKDAQQAIIIQRMVRDLGFPIQIRMVPTIREEDGLALSSRNVYLNPEERAQASSIHEGLQQAQDSLLRGSRDARSLEQAVRDAIASHAPLARVDYVTVVDLHSLQPIEGTIGGDMLLAVAAYFGTTRLIDNIIVRFDGENLRIS